MPHLPSPIDFPNTGYSGHCGRTSATGPKIAAQCLNVGKRVWDFRIITHISNEIALRRFSDARLREPCSEALHAATPSGGENRDDPGDALRA